MSIKYAPIKPSNIFVLFPSGAGGNFLIKLLAEKYIFAVATAHNPALKVDYASSQMQANEFSSDYFPIIAPRHLHQLFMPAGGIKSGEPVYSLRRYRQLLSAYQYSKFIIVHTTPTERVYCESLNILKSIANNPDKFRLSQEDKIQELRDNIKNDFTTTRQYSLRRPHHYREFSRWLKHQGTHVLDVDYHDLFVEPELAIYDQLGGFVIGRMNNTNMETAESVVKQCRQYHRDNQKLIKDFVARDRLKSIVRYEV